MSTPLIGHRRQLEYFNRVVERGRLAHAYLFYGPAHVGKKTTARLLSEKLGSAPVILDPDHPLVPKKNAGTRISIEDIRELRRQNSFRPEGENWRIAVIDEADTMSEEAANAFLKLLEEPGQRTLFILISESREDLPSTIASRAQAIRFTLLPEAEMSEFLSGKKITDGLAKKFLSIAAGRPGILMQLCGDASYAARELDFFEKAAKIFRNRDSLLALAFSAQAMGDDASRIRATEYCLRYLRKELLLNAHDRTRVRNILPRIEFADRCLTMLSTSNVNPRLVMDAMFLETLGPNYI